MIMADKQMFKVMVELLDSKEEEETKGHTMTRSWLKKREELGYFTNIPLEISKSKKLVSNATFEVFAS